MYAIEIIVFVLMILAILEIITSTKLGQIVIKTVTFKKKLNPISAGELENQDMLGGRFDPHPL